MFILRVLKAFQDKRIEFALCGGQAVALHGAVRGTLDVDLLLRLTEKNLKAVESVLLHDLKLVSRIPIRADDMIQFREEYIKNKNLTAWSFVNPLRASEVVDLIITKDLEDVSVVFKEAWGQKIPVLSIPDLIAMKAASGRPQDLADIEALKMILGKKKK